MSEYQIENKKAPSRKSNEWRKLFEKLKTSNESANDFCNRLNINRGTFVHWRSKFSREARSKKFNQFLSVKAGLSEEVLDPRLIIAAPNGYKFFIIIN